MPDGAAGLSLMLHPAIAEIDAAVWDACAGGANPFVSHAFLAALEESGSVGRRTGWLARHASLRDADGTVLAVVPMYAKAHSYGEYVFDHGWADALERAGGAYYPKLQVAVPFSPVPGPRLLIHPDAGARVNPAMLGQALISACRQLDCSSVHVTFCTAAERDALATAGYLPRLGMQFHWENAGYADFDGFLAALSSRKRKVLRRERRDANACGLEFRTLRGAAIEEAHWDAFFAFYHATVDRKWGSAYLTRDFFSRLSARLGDAVVLMMAFEGTRPVAGALNLMGRDTLYGRNWGCEAGREGEWPFLHFELCYYRAIAFAIEHGLARVEAGAQGRHKIQRGYAPQATYSAHWIAHGGLRRAVKGFLEEERAGVEAEMAALAEGLPFRESDVAAAVALRL
ncbi:MAG: N-acetyltransferase [Rhodospirillales bacterium]|nr:N-acetyltransferase [Rhodospirillales bacterium]